ncbi:MAG: FAD-binding oxidoreductase [Gemmatimonadaceae bacterium]
MRGDAEVAAAIREAGVARIPLRIVGRGTWLDAGSPVAAETTLSLIEDAGIQAYAPGDLTVTVRAGTTLREVTEALARSDQWVALDPEGDTDGTIGATVATCSYGPAAALFGTPRDQVLGMTVVLGNGDIIRPGGKVVKNVAGFDLTRLMIGAWGTLGVITEITLRVRSRTMLRDSIAHMRRQLPASHGYRDPIVVNAKLVDALRQRFDPFRILNPGIMRDVG